MRAHGTHWKSKNDRICVTLRVTLSLRGRCLGRGTTGLPHAGEHLPLLARFLGSRASQGTDNAAKSVTKLVIWSCAWRCGVLLLFFFQGPLEFVLVVTYFVS